MKFVHLADTHIRNLKYHKEYREVFSQLYVKLQEIKPDFIIHCGDIAHTKTQISPEFVEMCSNFLSNLADIAPTYVILGNHDGNLKNSSRQDALTPIVEALNHSQLYLLKNSGEEVLNENFAINVLSVFDKDNWQSPTNPDRVNIALYHGSISGVKTDTNWIMEHGENDISIFNNFDYSFLGDIHKTNQSLDQKGKIRYCGSTVQQNHGETNDKGFLVWDIQDKDTYTCEHHILKNPKPFITIVLTPKGRIPSKTEVPLGARLRLVSENNLPLDVIRKSIDVSKRRFKPEAITFLNRSDSNADTVGNMANDLINEDLRNIAVQEDLITEYLKDYQASEETMEKVFSINRLYNTRVEEEEEVSRNINWRLKKLEWDNLFNYSEGNSIQFSNLDGIVGVFGKNFSGKSSIIDSLLYTLYNTTSKNNRKSYNIINQNKESCRGYVEIDIGTKTYKVERISTKYIKKLKGKETNEAKTELDFRVFDNAIEEERELNGTSVTETNKNIRKIFGPVEDFLLTSMASQLGSLTFISEGSTKRKEILAKFLDLEFFDKKFRRAKEDNSDIKALVRNLEKRNFEQELKEARTEFAQSDTLKLKKERECQDLQAEIAELNLQFVDLDTKINSIPAEIIDIHQVNEQIEEGNSLLENLTKSNEHSSSELEKAKTMFSKLDNFLTEFDAASLEEKQKLIEEKKNELSALQVEMEKYEDQIHRQRNKIKLLNEVPCGSEFSHCKFIKDAYTAKDNLENSLIVVNELALSKSTTEKNVEDLNPDQVADHIENYEKVIEKRSSTQSEINNLELSIEKNKTKMLKVNNLLQDLEVKRKEYEDNRDAIENLENLLKERKEAEKTLNSNKKTHTACQKQVMELYKTNGSLEQKVSSIEEEIQEAEDLQEKFAACDLFLRCMHPNGISYDIIKKRSPVINTEIAKILTNITDFEIFFENEDNRLHIMIKHPGYEARPIEMGSGAEKTIAAMAIRLALLNVSTLPKGDIFILDEPGTALDEENMEGFLRILEMIKAQFKTVLLISHLDSLKDAVDTQITIDKVDGYANVNQ